MYKPSATEVLKQMQEPKQRPQGHVVDYGDGRVWCDDRRRLLTPEEVAELYAERAKAEPFMYGFTTEPGTDEEPGEPEA